MTAASIQDRSSSLLVTLASSLLSSFSPSDVVSDSGKAICATALLTVSSLSRKGYLAGSSETAQVVAQLLSLYSIDSPTSSYRRRLSSSSSGPYDLSAAASSLVQGVQLGMVYGETPVSLVTPNVQLSVTSTLISASSNIVLSTPATESQLTYGSIQPKLTLGPLGLKSCAYSGRYAQLSVLQWSKNPYAGSKAVQSPLLRLTAAAQSVSTVASQAQQSGISFSLPGVPAYYLSLQFSSIQKFDFSAVSSTVTAATAGPSNFTFPACTLYNGVAYVPCKSCNISSYTDYNVTYSCFDITQLCPSSSSKRHLVNEDYGGAGVVTFSSNDNDDDEGVDVKNEMEDGDIEIHERYLTTNDDTSTSSVFSLSYGVLIQSVKAELHDVLSINPFNLDLAHSTVVLTFMGCLTGFIVIVIYFLLRKDTDERLYKGYVKSEADKLAKMCLEVEMSNGGNGDMETSYQKHVEALNQDMIRAKSFLNLLARSLSRKGDHSQGGAGTKTGAAAGATFLGIDFAFDRTGLDEIDSEVGEEKDDDMDMKKDNDSDIDSLKNNHYGDSDVDVDGVDDFSMDSIYPCDGDRKSVVPAKHEGERGIESIGEDGLGINKKSRNRQKASKGIKEIKEMNLKNIPKSKQFGPKAVVTQFLCRLFPGSSIFIKRKNAFDIIRVHHNYFSMFVSSAVSQSRTIRFLDLVSLILTSIFADTIFFGIFYPIASTCTSMTSKVHIYLNYCLRSGMRPVRILYCIVLY